MKRISDLLKGVDVISVTGDYNAEVASVEFDSRKVTP